MTAFSTAWRIASSFTPTKTTTMCHYPRSLMKDTVAHRRIKGSAVCGLLQDVSELFMGTGAAVGCKDEWLHQEWASFDGREWISIVHSACTILVALPYCLSRLMSNLFIFSFLRTISCTFRILKRTPPTSYSKRNGSHPPNYGSENQQTEPSLFRAVPTQNTESSQLHNNP